MNKQTSITIMIIGLLPLVMVLGNSMLIPILPLMELELRITPFEAGLLLSVFSIVAAVVIPIVGFLSDRFGRKKLVLISLAFVMIGSILTIIAGELVAEPFLLVFIGRIIQGIGAGGTAPLAMALVGDLFEGSLRSKSLGVLEVFNGIGKVISPFLGAMAAIFFWYSVFYIYFLLAIVAFLGIYFFVSTANQEKNNQSLANYRRMLVSVLKREASWLFPVSFLGAVGLFILFGLLVFLSFEIERIYAVDGIFKGIVFTIPLGALTVTSYWAGNNIGNNLEYMKKLLLVGIILQLLALLVLLFFHQLLGLVFGLTIFSTGLGLILPCVNTLITSSVGSKERGLIVSVYAMVRFFGVAFGPILFSLWMDSRIHMYVKAIILLMISSLWVITSLKLTSVIILMRSELKKSFLIKKS
ncbi:MFS transporter [Bacillaceae bacterium IKA-2]|nr:MFS transporter [Bacillaceae bacterium IKA-2]